MNSEFNILISNGKLSKDYLKEVAKQLLNVKEELTKVMETNQELIGILRLIAIIRICLTASADVLTEEGMKFITQHENKKELEEGLEALIGNLGLFFKDEKFRNTEIHMFFYRQITRKYGRQELKNIIKEYPWLKFNIQGNNNNQVSESKE